MRLDLRGLDLQAKIILILVAVIPPTFTIVTVAQNKLTQPILEEEFRQVGITTAKTLAAEIVSSRWLQLPQPTPVIESHIQSLIYSQPNIVRIDVFSRDPVTGVVKEVGSNIEDDPTTPQIFPPILDAVVTEEKNDEMGVRMWEVSVPIEQKSRDPRGPKRILGGIHLAISLKPVGRIMSALWRITVTGAAFTVVTLLLVLSYFLRKTITNDRLLKRVESHNLELSEQLHEAQRQLLNTEKLAVMGQLTASFAHEIGSPLNAIGGHLQLLGEDVQRPSVSSGELSHRLEIIQSQVSKIEEIVKSFLHSTAKPASQRQLSDINQLVDRALAIIQPRIESSRVRIEREFDRRMGPIRMVPLELEQIMLNLFNNSLDSLDSKFEKASGVLGSEPRMKIATRRIHLDSKEWAEISVYDTGSGIKKLDLEQVLKPFFTTKQPGEGTGLGLAICHELVHKYGGKLEIDSKEGAWTEVKFRIPF